jgi:hypothetical protein
MELPHEHSVCGMFVLRALVRFLAFRRFPMPATLAEPPTRPHTVSGRAAAIRLGFTHYTLLKYVALGRIRSVAEVGSPVRFDRQDVETLARELGKSGTSS